jgi:hypothetical protein
MKSNRDDIIEIIGELDDLTLERILTVGATRAELCEAALGAVMAYEMGESPVPNSNARVDTLQMIIEDLLRFEDEIEFQDSRIYSPHMAEGDYDRR